MVPYIIMEETFKILKLSKSPQLGPQTQEEPKRCSLPYTKVLFNWLYISRRDYRTTLLTRNSEQLCKGVISKLPNYQCWPFLCIGGGNAIRAFCPETWWWSSIPSAKCPGSSISPDLTTCRDKQNSYTLISLRPGILHHNSLLLGMLHETVLPRKFRLVRHHPNTLNNFWGSCNFVKNL